MYKRTAVFLSTAAISCCLLIGARGNAQTTVIVDRQLGTQVGSLPNPLDPSNPIPLLGGALLTVDSSGNRTLLSDFGDPGVQNDQPLGGGYLSAISSMPAGLLGLGRTILVLDALAGTNQQGMLFTVDPATGNRAVLTDFGNPSQAQSTAANGNKVLGQSPAGMAVANGLLGLGSSIYVVDNNAGTNENGAIFKVDPSTGNFTLFSDFGDSSQGQTGVNPQSIAIVPAGLLSILGANAGFAVLDIDAGTDEVGAVFIVDGNGNRTLWTDLGKAGTNGVQAVDPQAIAAAPSGLLGVGAAIYVIDNKAGTIPSGGTEGDGALFQIATDGSGTYSQVNDWGDASFGVLGEDPNGITAMTGLNGNVLVTDDFIESADIAGQLFAVNPSTGQRTVITDCSNTAQGPCQQPVAVTQF